MEQNEARRLELVEQRQNELETAVVRMSESAASMAKSVSQVSEGMKKLIELEVSHGETRSGLGRAFSEIKKVDDRVTRIECEMDDRVTKIEGEMPTLKLSRLVVAMCVGGILVIAGNKIWEAAFPPTLPKTSMAQGQQTGP